MCRQALQGCLMSCACQCYGQWCASWYRRASRLLSCITTSLHTGSGISVVLTTQTEARYEDHRVLHWHEPLQALQQGWLFSGQAIVTSPLA